MNKLHLRKTICFACFLGTWGAICCPAQTFTSLASFDYNTGAYPVGSLLQATDGNLYGTTPNGGTSTYCVADEYLNGCGTVFKLSPTGGLTTLYNFCSQANCTDGVFPAGELVQGTDGNLYGTTSAGGSCVYFSDGCGTVFRITLGGTLTTLYTFGALFVDGDGSGPVAGLIQATDGNFYGTTNAGSTYDWGTVFKITPDGTLTTLHSFAGADGAYPDGTLIQAADGDFYGITYGGGANGNGLICSASGGDCGTIFKITPSGTLTTLYNFCSQTNCTDGANPTTESLVQATDGNFYGTTQYGGAYDSGTVFKITPAGTLTRFTVFAPKRPALTAKSLQPGWCKQPTAISTGRIPTWSSKLPPAAR